MRHSARWLITNETSVCKSVFVAHSVLSAIWLLRQTLADNALPADAWAKLVSAAQYFARGSGESLPEAPPSALKPPGYPLPSTKRSAAPTMSLTLKRSRRNAASPDPSALQQPNLSQNSELAATPQLSSRPEDTVRRHADSEVSAQIISVTNNNRRAEHARALERSEA
jgi:hypothetical protein